MANIKSSKKRILQSNKRKIRNKAVKQETRTEIKKFNQLVLENSGNKEAITQQLRTVEKLVDKAVSKGVIHRNKAARIKSKLTKRLNAIIVSVSTQDNSTAKSAKEEVAVVTE